MCLGPEETHFHLFILCLVANRVWQQLVNWIGLDRLNFYDNILDYLKGFEYCLKERLEITSSFFSGSQLFGPYDKLKREAIKGVDEIVSRAKALSWKWFGAKAKGLIASERNN